MNPRREYILCTDADLERLLFILSAHHDTAYSRREVKKVKAEIERRERAGRNPLIRELRRKNKLSS
tara:strand:- start:214 stop:411 length:198 start_codon:yes stop_codon:yes gene_type:complete